MYFIISNDGQDDRVELVENGEPQVCEGHGKEVTTYLVTAEDDTWRMVECLPCALKTMDAIRPESRS